MHTPHKPKPHACLALALLVAFTLSACEREPRVAAYDNSTIEQRYGLSGTSSELVRTDDGAMDATVVPITLSDGRTAQLVIPKNRNGVNRLYLRDENGLTPVALQNPRVSREEFVRSEPRIVERQVVEERHYTTVKPKNKRSLKKELLIVGGAGGAGAAIGALAGGGKGAAIGGVSGGIAGLVYDLATRKK